jgi:hypothetical protein
MNAAARRVTLRHPNAVDCVLFNKVVNRVSTGNANDGSPLLGGMGVLNSDDEHDYDYEEKGKGRLVFLGIFQTDGSNFLDNDESISYYGNLVEALIEPVSEPDEAGFFLPDKHDLLTVDMGAGVIQSYQIVGVTGSVAVPPYTRRYVLNPRNDDELGV